MNKVGYAFKDGQWSVPEAACGDDCGHDRHLVESDDTDHGVWVQHILWRVGLPRDNKMKLSLQTAMEMLGVDLAELDTSLA